MDATFEFLKALLAHLRSDPAIAALAGDRIYDRVPSGQKPQWPYIEIGASDALNIGAECLDALEFTVQLDCWSMGKGEAFSSAEVRKLSGAVRACVDNAELTLSSNALASLEHRVTRYQRETDAGVNRAIVTITAVIEIG